MLMAPAVSFRHVRSIAVVGRFAAFLLLPAWLTLVASPCRAQVVLEGRVLDDSTSRAIVGAQVLLENQTGQTVRYQQTDSLGRFHFELGKNERYRLEARAIGYLPARRTVLWMMEERDFAGLEVRLTPHAILLAPVEVVALAPPKTSPIFQNMEFRRLHGFGLRITRQQIETRSPQRISDMLQETPGVEMGHETGGPDRRVLRFGQLFGPGGRDCPVQIFLDGMLATRSSMGGEVTVDELVQPQDVEAIEIFKGLATVPAEFLNERSRCGVVAIWTKRSLP